MSRTTRTLTPGRSPTSASAATAGRHPTPSPSTSRTSRTAGRRFDSPFAAPARTIEVDVNGQPAGQVDRLIGDGAIARHSSQGLWYERELSFDASLLKQGTNVLKLIVPAGPINNGVIYDYLRLELDDLGAPAAASATAPPPCSSPATPPRPTAPRAPSAGASTSRRSSTRRRSRSSTSPAEGGAAGRSSPRGSGTACSKA